MCVLLLSIQEWPRQVDVSFLSVARPVENIITCLATRSFIHSLVIVV